jgi:hypothetical protein
MVIIRTDCTQGGRISGSSTIVQFDAWRWEAAVKQMMGFICTGQEALDAAVGGKEENQGFNLTRI